MPANALTMVTGLGQVSIPARDVARATAFYRDAVGLPLLFEVSGMSFFDCGGVRLMVALPEGAELDPPGSVLYYRVQDIRAAHAAMVERGVEFEGEPHLIAAMPDHELWMAFFRDTEGNMMALMAEVR
jgi:predicted enzyme related to lactoylglutathione lyase